MNEEILKLEDISFSYGKNAILKSFSLSVEKGSFTTLLGPSGCGKTTLLRLIAGFLKPDEGRILINGRDVSDVPVEERRIGFVFQDYALFPHMTVKENLLFGFSHKEKKSQLSRVEEISASLELYELLERYPHELSGGQQQRVALGRTLMMKPEIILMDEPLSSLDAKLRLKVREELQEIQRNIGITTIYVTHDQEEALSLSSKIAVMNEGKLLQHDTPENVYFNPSDKETAELTGQANFLKMGGKLVMVRPEWFSVDTELEKDSQNKIEGTVVSSSFLGAVVRYKLECAESLKGYVTADIRKAKGTDPSQSKSLSKGTDPSAAKSRSEGTAPLASLQPGKKVILTIDSSVCFDN